MNFNSGSNSFGAPLSTSSSSLFQTSAGNRSNSTATAGAASGSAFPNTTPTTGAASSSISTGNQPNTATPTQSTGGFGTFQPAATPTFPAAPNTTQSTGTSGLFSPSQPAPAPSATFPMTQAPSIGVSQPSALTVSAPAPATPTQPQNSLNFQSQQLHTILQQWKHTTLEDSRMFSEIVSELNSQEHTLRTYEAEMAKTQAKHQKLLGLAVETRSAMLQYENSEQRVENMLQSLENRMPQFVRTYGANFVVITQFETTEPMTVMDTHRNNREMLYNESIALATKISAVNSSFPELQRKLTELTENAMAKLPGDNMTKPILSKMSDQLDMQRSIIEDVEKNNENVAIISKKLANIHK